ncbi:sensor histidine kinase [Sphingomonas hankookensis]|uniref:sensor histidine kinase n=1 Tax=Sphingomonas hankookensis TaxID=563996 RepID=UPI003D30395F
MRPEHLRWRDIRSTSAFRSTVILGGIALGGIVALLVLVYVLTSHELTARSDRLIHARAARWLAAPAAGLPALIDADIEGAAAGTAFGGLFARGGERISGNIPELPADLGFRPATITLPDHHTAIRVIRFQTRSGETLLVGRDVALVADLRRRLLLILLAGGVMTLIGVTIAAALFSRRPLRRIRDLNDTAHKIAAGRLDVRMPDTGSRDELDQFARTVNGMIGHVERLMGEVKGVTDAIAHDLRTPLTRVRSQLHRVRIDPALPPPLAALLDAAQGDLAMTLDRFNALLRISEIEAGARRAHFRPVAMGPLLAEVVALYDPLAEDHGIALTLATDAPGAIDADPGLLFEALSNLIDNAIKFARRRVSVAATDRDGRMTVTIRDDGPGIPPEERTLVVQRFWRGRDAGTRRDRGWASRSARRSCSSTA